MEQATLDYINGLPISDEDKSNLITAIEWEKEISWSQGYEACDDGKDNWTIFKVTNE